MPRYNTNILISLRHKKFKNQTKNISFNINLALYLTGGISVCRLKKKAPKFTYDQVSSELLQLPTLEVQIVFLNEYTEDQS